MKYHTSPQRFDFLKNNREKDASLTPEQKKDWEGYIEKCRTVDSTPSKDQPCLENDLRHSELIANKCKSSEAYSQNLYAAMCNNEFIKDGKSWTCSWRHSGGIVANLREEGDYIDWYCSGIGMEPPYVAESFVTEEIRKDIESFGWEIKPIEKIS